MSIRRANVWRLVVLALLYFFYYGLGWELADRHTSVPPLLINGILVPLLFGMAAYFWFRGSLVERAGFVLAMPLGPLVFLGLEADPASSGQQWVGLAWLQVYYWFGAVVAAAFNYLALSAFRRRL